MMPSRTSGFFSLFIMTLAYGPHTEKENIAKYSTAQIFITSPQAYVTQQNYPAFIPKFPKNNGKLTHIVAHVGYVNHIQSLDKKIVDKSFEDIRSVIKVLKAVYGDTDVKCYVNIHMRSKQAYNHERLLDSIKDMPKNCMLVIEHLPFDPFDEFYD